MDTTSCLIVATVAGPVAGALVTPGFTRAVLRLARSRAQRVQHVEASGADLYNDGVPLTETQFREACAAMEAELDQLPPAAERNDWQLKRQYAAINRMSVLAGTYPQAFPIRSNADDAWQCRFMEGNPTTLPETRRTVLPKRSCSASRATVFPHGARHGTTEDYVTTSLASPCMPGGDR